MMPERFRAGQHPIGQEKNWNNATPTYDKALGRIISRLACIERAAVQPSINRGEEVEQPLFI